jgi:hypothetical protein
MRGLAPALALGTALVFLASCADSGGDEAGAGEEAPASGEEGVTVVDEVGFATPESVLHDEVADIYLVSNISGEPLGQDDDGFISRMTPGGEVETLRWIDGADEAVTLHAPKGMAILGDSLYVADIDCVRIFVRTTGEAAGEVCIGDATFLNDITVDDNNTLYVTDMGMAAGEAEGELVPSGTDAVHRFTADGRSSAFIEGEELGRPNGLAFGSRGLFLVSYGSGEIAQLTAQGTRVTVLPPGDRQLDGIVFTPEGGFLFSNWTDQTVRAVGPGGSIYTVAEGIPSPGDIGLDAQRDRVLVPSLSTNAVWIVELPETGPPTPEEAGEAGDR